MKLNNLEIDSLIEGLNNHKDISSIVANDLNNSSLTEVEQDFIKIYKPEKALIIYGSLAPGRSNHSVIGHINGDWQKAIIRGKLEKKGWGVDLGYYAFRHCAPDEQEVINAVVLFSDELVENWPHLDDFEGDGYRRILAKYELDTGEVGVGYIYATSE